MTESTFAMILIRKRIKEYIKASRKEKGQILDDLKRDTGRHRKSIIRTLRTQRQKPFTSPGRPKKYDKQSMNLIDLIWEYNDYIAAERFHNDIEGTLKDLKEAKLLENYPNSTIELVEKIPLGTLKAKLQKIPKPRRKSGETSNTELKRQVPIRTGFKPSISYGYFAIDFVDSCGGNNSGRFVRTLCGIDPKETWLSRGACIGRDRESTEYANDVMMKKIPYPLRGMHSDNESNLLYNLLKHKAKEENFVISRIRPYRKEDNGHVEQKNGDKIRRLIGYRRYDNEKQLKLINEIYRLDDLYQNHFIRSMRLESKEYDELGKLTKKVYSEPITAYQRILEDEDIPKEVKVNLKRQHLRLNRVKLKQERDRLLKILFDSR